MRVTQAIFTNEETINRDFKYLPKVEISGAMLKNPLVSLTEIR